MQILKPLQDRAIGLAFFASVTVSAQVIGTYAGTEYTFPSDPVAAQAAALAEPWAFARDTNGAIYFSQGSQILRLAANYSDISVFAGNGIAGFSGDGGNARAASMNSPTALAFDLAGNLFFCDSGNHRVRRIALNGTITTVAGTGRPGVGANGVTATASALNGPIGLAFDLEGRLNIVDTQNHRVRRIDNAGRISTIAGVGEIGFAGDNGPAIRARFAFPLAIHPDTDGNLYVADDNNKLIRRISPGGTVTTVAGNTADGFAGDGQSALLAAFRGPRDARPDGNGGILIADHFNRRVRRVNPAGRIDTVAGTGVSGFSGDGDSALQAQLAGPNATLPEPGGNFLIADAVNRRIRRVAGGIISTIGGIGIPAGDPSAARESQLLGNVTNLRLDAQQNIFYTDRSTSRVMRLAPNGNLTVVAGNGVAGFSGDNGAAIRAQLNVPYGLAMDRTGTIFFTEFEGDRIRRVASNGVISTVAGTGVQGWSGDGPALTNTVNHPRGATLDSAGNLYFADFGNNRIRRLTTGGMLETVAGSGVQCPNDAVECFNGDNRTALATNLHWPSAVVISANGTFFISDTRNHVVRRFQLGGTMNIVAGTGQFGYTGDGGNGTSARLNGPTDLALDSAGNLYIADSGNNVIRVVSPAGTIRTFAGTGDGGFQGDGGLAVDAWLNGPIGLLTAADDSVFIADSGNGKIRQVLASAPAVGVPAPAAVSLGGVSGGGSTDRKTVALHSPYGGLRYSVIVADDARWLRVSQKAGALPAGIQVWADATDLTPGSYSTNLVFSTPSARPAAQVVRVQLQVGEPEPAVLKPGSQSVILTGLGGGRAVESAVAIGIGGSGAVDLRFGVESTAGQEWLTFGSAAASASADTPAMVRLIADPAKLQRGTYTVKVVVRGVPARGGAELSARIPVTFVVNEARPQLVLSREALTFEVARSSGISQAQPVHILNTGQGSLNWRAMAATLSGGQWLLAGDLTGSVQPGSANIGTARVSVNAQALNAGTYFGTVTVAAGAGGTRLVVVRLTVVQDSSTLAPELQPSALVFAGGPADRPGSQTVTLVNRRPAAITYTTIPTTSGSPWLRYTPSSATIPGGGKVQVTLQADFEKLSAGLSAGSLLFRFDDGSSQTVEVLAAVDAGGPSDSEDGGKEPGRSADCSATLLTIRLLNGQTPVRVRWGQPFNLDFSVTDNCGRLAASGSSGVNLVAGAFATGEPGGAFQPAAGGNWTRTFTLSSPASRTAQASSVKIAAATQGSGFRVAIGFSEITLAVTDTQSVAPRVDRSVNGASFEVDVPVAPGSIVTLFGQSLGPLEGVTPANGSSATTLDGTEVLLADQALPLLYASNGQVNAQIPFGVEANNVLQLRVKRGDTISSPSAIAVADARPAVYTVNQTGQGLASAINQNGSLNGPNNPAREGTIVAVYCTGLGRLSPPIKDGEPAPADILSHTVIPVAVFVNGLPAEVLFSGAGPGLMGVYQVNVRIPRGAYAEREARLILQTTGQESPPVTLYIAAANP